MEQCAPENDIFAGFGTPVVEDWKPFGATGACWDWIMLLRESGQPREYYTVESTHLAVGYSTVVVDCFELPVGADRVGSLIRTRLMLPWSTRRRGNAGMLLGVATLQYEAVNDDTD